jgi:hypothetical protein
MIFGDENLENQLQQPQGRSSKGHQATIRNALQELCIPVDFDLNQIQPVFLNALEAVICDRDHWRREALAHSQESSRMYAANMTLEKEKDLLSSSIECMKRDLIASNARYSSQINEQRELRNHWMAEKADLQSRFCQVQSLNTQIQGSLKKKEKEFEKLQNQLTKIVKDSCKSVKSTMIVSLPLKKPTSQENITGITGALLRDAEVSALKRSVQQFQHENSVIQRHLESIKLSLADLQSVFDNRIREVEDKHKLQLESMQTRNEWKNMEVAPTSQSKWNLENNYPQTPESNQLGCLLGVEVKSMIKSCVNKTPGTIAKKYLEGTPGVRPLNAIIQQTNTEIKNLRSCIDDITNNSATQNNEITSELQDACAKIVNLRAKLAEALVVIEEQDHLIHECKFVILFSMVCQLFLFSFFTALLGKLPGGDSNQTSLEWDVDLDEDDLFEKGNSLKPSNDITQLSKEYSLPPGKLVFIYLSPG